MRINYFLPRCTPDNSHGRYVVELSKRFGRDHPVTVYSGALWDPLRPLVRYRFIPVPVRPALARLAVLWTAGVALKRRRYSDIVHIQGADAPVGNLVTAHCCNSAMRAAAGRQARFGRRLNYAIGSVVERYCMSKATTRRIIAVSQKVKEEIQSEYGIDPHRIVVIPNGVDGEVFHPRNKANKRNSVREGLGLAPNEFVAMFVGGEYRIKGLVPLLAAARKVEGEMKVLAVGVQPDSTLKRLLAKDGLSKIVTFAGHTTDVASLYAAADCFVLPTLYDTFSLATLEALASGLPVIVSRAAGVTELLSTDRDCLLLEDPENVEDLAQRLSQLIADEALRKRLGAEGRRTAEQLSWDAVAARTFAVYNELLATHS